MSAADKAGYVLSGIVILAGLITLGWQIGNVLLRYFNKRHGKPNAVEVWIALAFLTVYGYWTVHKAEWLRVLGGNATLIEAVHYWRDAWEGAHKALERERELVAHLERKRVDDGERLAVAHEERRELQRQIGVLEADLDNLTDVNAELMKAAAPKDVGEAMRLYLRVREEYSALELELLEANRELAEYRLIHGELKSAPALRVVGQTPIAAMAAQQEAEK